MKTQCPNCKSKFNVNETNVGKQAKCPKCTQPFTIEPFVDIPPTKETPVFTKPPVPPAEPVKAPEPVVPQAKIAAPSAAPVKNPEPVLPPVTAAVPVAAPVKEEKNESKAVLEATLSKTVFVYCWAGIRIIAGALGTLGLILAIQKGANSTLIAAFAAADVFLIGSAAIELMLFYKMWEAIKDSQTSISPGRAIGFLFIPVFNIYWALLMLTGFVEDYNAFIQRRVIKTQNLSLTLFLIYAFAFILAATVLTVPMICIFAFLGLISRAFIGYPGAAWTLFALMFAAGAFHFIAYILFAMKTCNAVNALPGKQGV